MKKVNSSEILIYLCALCAPLYLIQIKLLAVPTNLLEIIITLTFFVWLLEKNSLRSLGLPSIKITLALAILLLGIILSALFNDNYSTSFGIIKGWFIFPILYGMLVYNKINTSEKARRLLFSIFLSATVVSILSLLFYYLPGNMTFDNRLSAFYLSPNHLAMFLAPGLLAILALPSARRDSYNFFKYFGGLLILTSLYLTHSYATWLSVFLAYLLFIFLLRKSFTRIDFIKSTLIIVSIFIFFIYSQKDSSKFQSLISIDDRSSLSSRIIIWQSSIKILSDNWMIGIGSGNFQEKYLEYQKYFPPYLDWAVPQPHNLYLAFWLQGGFLGILSFILVIYFWIKEVIIDFKKFSQHKKKLTVALLAIMVYFLIHGVMDTTYWKNDLALVFWAVFFLGLNLLPPLPLERKHTSADKNNSGHS